MLFDLRSRGRRRTVQAIYLMLSLIMVGGLLLVGVGTGNGGGILNAFTNNGSGSNQNQAVSAQEKQALKAVKLNPSDPEAWRSLVVARWTTASGSDYNSSTGSFTAAGKRELNGAAQAWQRYLALTKQPDATTAILAAHAYGALADYPHQASAWEFVANANPNEVKAFECLAATAYAAKQTRKGDLAAAKAVILVPKAQRFELQQQLKQAKTNPAIAQASC
jgi:hypothetical protein